LSRDEVEHLNPSVVVLVAVAVAVVVVRTKLKQ
jgi:hypothetical protein